MKMKTSLSIPITFIAAAVLSSCTTPTGQTDNAARARQFIAAHEAKVRPLEKMAGIAWWNANVTGKDEDFKAKEDAQNKLDAALC